MTDTLTVAPDLVAIRAIGPWLRSVLAERLGGDTAEPFAMRCELALQELAANIVSHGYGDDPTPSDDPISVRADVTGDVLRVVVVDHGAAYDPDDQLDPDPDEPQVHGYGLMILRQLTRIFTYQRVDGTNRTTLEFDLPDDLPDDPTADRPDGRV